MLMRSALGEPPCSGVGRFSPAAGASTSSATAASAAAMDRTGVRRAARKARGILLEADWARRPLGPLEPRGAFLRERHHALGEVAGGGHLLLDVGLELELLVHPAVE